MLRWAERRWLRSVSGSTTVDVGDERGGQSNLMPAAAQRACGGASEELRQVHSSNAAGCQVILVGSLQLS